MALDVADSDLKARHRAMWASGDYPRMVETFLLPIGPRLVDACPISAGTRVLDVAAGTGNASLPAAARGGRVTASDLTPELLEAGRRRADAEGLELEWTQADAERLPFPDGSFDVVMSAIGVMFAPHHQAAADELVRVCRPGGTVALLSWTPEGMIGELFRTMKPFMPPPPPGAQPAPLWGSEEHLQALMGGRVEFDTLERDVLEITAFEHPRDYGEHFKAHYQREDRRPPRQPHPDEARRPQPHRSRHARRTSSARRCALSFRPIGAAQRPAASAACLCATSGSEDGAACYACSPARAGTSPDGCSATVPAPAGWNNRLGDLLVGGSALDP